MIRKGQFLMLVLMLTTSAHSQGLLQPPPGKAVVHFVFDDSARDAEPFSLFFGRSPVGEFNHGTCHALTVDPGRHLFWVWQNDPVWIEAELASDRMYIVFIGKDPRADVVHPFVRVITDRSTNFGSVKKIIEQNPSLESGPRQSPSDRHQLRALVDKYFPTYVQKNRSGHRVIRVVHDDDVGRGDFQVPLISH